MMEITEMEIAGLEARLRGRLAYHSVANIPDFPFATYDEFVQADKDGKAETLIAARAFNQDARLVWALGTQEEKTSYTISLATPALMALGFVLFAFVCHDFWLLFGVLACLLGVIGASPNLNLLDGCLALLCFVGANIASIFLHSSLLFVGCASPVSLFLSSFALAFSMEFAQRAVTRSETIFLWMYQRKKVQIVTQEVIIET
jgi:hypothetical protein